MKRLAPALILLLAFALRVVGLDSVPPGWRDDEVIETTVHAQLVLDGHHPLYFIQAEGHEPLYHYLTAGWIRLVGRSLFSVRLVSAFFGLLTAAAAYRLTCQLFGARAALLVALLLAVSFWALIYSRTKIRHIAELPFALLAFSLLLHNLRRQAGFGLQLPSTILAGFLLAGALYTYFAAITLLLIVLGLCAYLIATRRPAAVWGPMVATLGITAVGYLPLAVAIDRRAERISIVGEPLTALREGDPQPFIENVVGTLAMFGHTGDNEGLYNIPGRPVFNVVGFYFFFGGVIIALSRWRDPRHAFLLIWLGGGLAPGFASNPPASLGHTLTALPVTYILAALPVFYFSPQRSFGRSRFSPGKLLGVLLFVSIAAQDLPDYFRRWPALPEVRYLYKADLHATANRLRGEPPATYVLTGPLSKWDRVAFTLEGLDFESPPRWVNGEWAIVFPTQPARYLFTPADWQIDAPPVHSLTVHFGNDLVFEGWDQRGRDVIAHWRAGPAYAAAEPDMGSSTASPPFPAFAFAHLLGVHGDFIAGSDRFDVDAFALQPGDRFLQRHSFDAPPGTFTLEIGLYNPANGERYRADNGQDSVSLGAITLP